MIIDIPYVADILTISHSRQALIDSCLLKENAKRISHDYRIGESVMKKSILSLCDKLLPSFTGPYIIEQVHTNGTCTIRLTPNQTKHINIRRLKPYRAQGSSWCGRVKYPHQDSFQDVFRLLIQTPPSKRLLLSPREISVPHLWRIPMTMPHAWV